MRRRDRVSGAVTGLRHHYATTCDLPAFRDPDLVGLMTDISPWHPADRPHRKAWEYAVTAAFLRDCGVLDGRSRVLDVGAGSSALLFWLTRHVGEVVAADTYGRGAFAAGEADHRMLTGPEALAPYDYRRERLRVLDADARALPLPDASVDAVVSLSSLEHVGDHLDIARAAAEAGRVLRPGGVAMLITEVFLRVGVLHHRPVATAVRVVQRRPLAPVAGRYRRPVEVLRRRELHRWLVAPSGCELVQDLRVSVGPEARRNPQLFPRRGGEVFSRQGAEFPHVVVGFLGSRWTSVALPLRKPDAG